MENRDRLKRVAARPAVVAVASLTLLWVLFFWRLLTPTVQDRVIFAKGDFTLHYFSFSDYQAERLWQGEIPLWNPYNHAGDPFAANVQWATWYPPRWIAVLLAGKGGWDVQALQLEVAAHYWLVSLMTYAFLRTLTRHPLPALVGAVIFTYGGYLTGYPMLQVSILESVAWLPLLLLGVHLSVTRWRINGLLLGGLAIGLSFFGGHPQTTLQLIYLALAYLVFVGRRRGLGWIDLALRAGLLVGFGGALAAVQLVPALEFTRLSYRVNQYYYAEKASGFTPTELLQVLWPRTFGTLWWSLYVGAAGLLLAVGALFRLKPVTAFWLGVVVIGGWLSLGGGSVVYDFFYVFVPGFSIFRQQERVGSLVVFALAVLAAYQVDWLFSPRDESSPTDERRFRGLALGHLALAALVFLAVTVAALVQGDPPGDLSHAMGFTLLVSLCFNGWLIGWLHRRPDRPSMLAAALPALLVVDLFTIGTRAPNFVPDIPQNYVQPPVMAETLQSQGQNILWRVDGAVGLQGHGAYFRIPDIYGTGPFSLDSIERLRQIPVDRFWDVLAVRYVTTADDPPETVPLDLLAYGTNPGGQEYELFELADPRPFAHLVYSARVEEDNSAFVRQIMADPRINLREIAITTGPLPFDLPGERPPGGVVESVQMVNPERIEMTVSTPENALLTVSVLDYPGWRATVDGKRVSIVDTYAGLIGIPVTPGQNQRVVLEFEPKTVIAGGVISLLALVGGIAAVIVPAVRRRGVGIRRVRP